MGKKQLQRDGLLLITALLDILQISLVYFFCELPPLLPPRKKVLVFYLLIRWETYFAY